MSPRIDSTQSVKNTNLQTSTNTNSTKKTAGAIDLTTASVPSDDMTGLTLERNPNEVSVNAGYYSRNGNSGLELGVDYNRELKNSDTVSAGASIYTGNRYQVRAGYEFSNSYSDNFAFTGGANVDVSWGEHSGRPKNGIGNSEFSVYPNGVAKSAGYGRVTGSSNSDTELSNTYSSYDRRGFSSPANSYSTWAENPNTTPQTSNTWNQAGLSLRAGVRHNVNNFTFTGGISSRSSIQFESGDFNTKIGLYGGAEYNVGDAIKDKVKNPKLAEGLTAGLKFDTSSKEFGVSIRKYF